MPENKEKIALFDFCETIVSFQSADRYVKFVVDNFATPTVRFRHKLYVLQDKLHLARRFNKYFHTHFITKELLLKQLKGVPYDVMDHAAQEYYNKVIRPNLISATIAELKRLQKEDYRIVIVSAGYDIYIEYFAKEFGIKVDDIHANQLLFKNQKFTGEYEKDCVGNVKVEILNANFQKEECYAVAYTDSESDLPMLNWADEGYWIRRKMNGFEIKQHKA